MHCPACRRDVPESSRYCLACGARLDASQAPTLTVAPADRLPSSDALDGAQFIPGTMLAGRYRIVGLLGRGGMGEVYRAEDLKLGQAVALKFLPKEVTHRADRLARFHQEVRLARQVSHPNVCRVHDIGETGGQHFLSMEYIDGEDLASLLRRIGRLPSDKALELARQLCAGLAAAHDRSVLHRDLKPANVLIDGRGRAHLADFGLANLTDQRRDTPEIAGTPGYMAPEQQEGREVTTRTDVYALGLVLYEMFTGKPALTVDGAFLGGRAQNRAPPASPSTHIPDLDPAIERVILRCLEHDPARRPPSAIAVAAALPGGNPLAAAIAAGETPSPDLVAAAGEAGTLSPAIGALCFAGVLIGLILLAPLMRDVSLIGLTKIELGPQALIERAHTVLRNLGYADPAGDEAVGYMTDIDYLQHIDEHDRSATRWRALATSQPPALLFWYRQSPRRLVPIGGTDIVTRLNPPATRSGMVSLTLDRTGRLVSLLAVRAQTATTQERSVASAQTSATDWTPLFAEAGLSIAQFSPAQPQWMPPIFADGRAAWQGAYPDRRDVPIRIEAAAVLGKPVYFEIVAPWTRPTNEDRGLGQTSGERVGLLMRTAVAPLVICDRRAAGAAESASWPWRSPRRVAVEPLHSCRRCCEQCAPNRRLPGGHQSSGGRRVRPGLRVAAVYRARATHPADLAGNHDRMEPIAGGQRSRPARGTRCAGRCARRDWQRIDLRSSHVPAVLVGPAAAISGWRLRQSVRRNGRLQRPAPRRALRALANRRLDGEHSRAARDNGDVPSLVRALCAPPAALPRDGGDDPGIDRDLRRGPRRLAARQRPSRSLRSLGRRRRVVRGSSDGDRAAWPSGSACSRCWSRRL